MISQLWEKSSCTFTTSAVCTSTCTFCWAQLESSKPGVKDVVSQIYVYAPTVQWDDCLAYSARSHVEVIHTYLEEHLSKSNLIGRPINHTDKKWKYFTKQIYSKPVMELLVQKQWAENKNLVYSKIYRQHLIVELGLYSYPRKGSYLELSNFFLLQ